MLPSLTPLFRLSVCTMLILAACDGTTREEHEDAGALCLRSSPPGTLAVQVQFGCLSSSCDRLIATSCNITRSEGELRVHSRTIVESDTAGSCTDDCGFARADCFLPDLPAGEYSITHGSQSTTISLPTSPRAIFDGGLPCP